MTKEGLEKYARENRKRLDAQEVKIGDVAKVLVGQFAGETGIVVGIIACDKSDYTDLYYEIALSCEVPEKYKCRKTLITPNNVVGGFAAHDFEVIGNRALKQPSMEIKQGDTVRVSGHYIAMMVTGGIVHNALNNATFVVDNIDREGRMAYVSCKLPVSIQSPIAHLVKVDAEAKEAKYRKGDKVCINKSSLKHGLLGEILTIIGVDVSDRTYYVQSRCMRSPIWLREDEISPYAEPTKQTDAEKKPNVDSIKIPVEVELSDSYWDAYAADLAKEVTVKSMEKSYGCDQERIADYAVKVAKAVVERLKRK